MPKHPLVGADNVSASCFFGIESPPYGGNLPMTKRTGFLQLEEIPLNKVGTGPRGKKCIANLSWEKLFAQLNTRKPRNGR
jgi:hypothetical protein